MFKKLNILPLHTRYILSVLFVVKNIDEFILTSSLINTRRRSDLYTPSVKSTKYKKRSYYYAIKIFNHLPPTIETYLGM